MTEEEYNHSSLDSRIGGISDFTFDEMQRFLNKLGYTLIVHTGQAMIYTKDIDSGGEVRYSEKGSLKDGYKRVLAINGRTKLLSLPIRVDSKEARELDALTVFHKEIKKRLLDL